MLGLNKSDTFINSWQFSQAIITFIKKKVRKPRKTMSLKKIERNYFKNEFIKRTKRIILIEEFQTTQWLSEKIVEYFIILE